MMSAMRRVKVKASVRARVTLSVRVRVRVWIRVRVWVRVGLVKIEGHVQLNRTTRNFHFTGIS